MKEFKNRAYTVIQDPERFSTYVVEYGILLDEKTNEMEFQIGSITPKEGQDIKLILESKKEANRIRKLINKELYNCILHKGAKLKW